MAERHSQVNTLAQRTSDLHSLKSTVVLVHAIMATNSSTVVFALLIIQNTLHQKYQVKSEVQRMLAATRPTTLTTGSEYPTLGSLPNLKKYKEDNTGVRPFNSNNKNLVDVLPSNNSASFKSIS